MSFRNLRALHEFLLNGVATLKNKTLNNPTIDNKYVVGSRFQVTFHNFASADCAKTFFIAPCNCKVIEARERHVTVAGQAGTLQVEKVPSGTAVGSGTVTLASAFDLTSTANTVVTKTALTTSASTLATGDALALKVASGASTSLALATLTVTMEVTA